MHQFVIKWIYYREASSVDSMLYSFHFSSALFQRLEKNKTKKDRNIKTVLWRVREKDRECVFYLSFLLFIANFCKITRHLFSVKRIKRCDSTA